MKIEEGARIISLVITMEDLDKYVETHRGETGLMLVVEGNPVLIPLPYSTALDIARQIYSKY